MQTQHCLLHLLFSISVLKDGPISLPIGEPLILEGKLLNLGKLNEFYKISIELSATTTIACSLISVTNKFISCQPNLGENLPNLSPKQMTVSMNPI